MNGALVVILALVWALVLLPGAVRSRRSSPTNSVGTFERAMDVLARRDSNPRGGDGRVIYVPSDAGRIVGERARRRNALIARRRQLFVWLVAGVGTTLPVAILAGGFAWALFLAATAALAVYVGLLLRWKNQAEEAAEVVRTLPDVPRARDVARDHERVAVGGERPYAGLQVATRDDDPWQPQSGVRIRRWDD